MRLSSLPRALRASQWVKNLLLLYLIVTTAYSTWLKRLPVLDVLLLAGLYTLRVLAGGAATGVTTSAWLLAFAMFLFLSPAFLKRLDGRGAAAICPCWCSRCTSTASRW